MIPKTLRILGKTWKVEAVKELEIDGCELTLELNLKHSQIQALSAADYAFIVENPEVMKWLNGY